MIVQIITVVRGDEEELEIALGALLGPILEANGFEWDDESLTLMTRLTHLRECPEPNDGDGAFRIAGFEIDIPDEVEKPGLVMDELVGSLADSAPFTHAVRFENADLQQELAEFAAQIFKLEMKLRRALTFVYLNAYVAGDPYALLAGEKVRPLGKEPPKPEQMRAAAENQFFHLTFSQYVELNTRPSLKLDDLLSAIAACSDLDSLKTELGRQPVEHADDAVFIAGLKSRMEPIEAMRNCVAHNRRPSRTTRENYQTAYAPLSEYLDEYLADYPAS